MIILFPKESMLAAYYTVPRTGIHKSGHDSVHSAECVSNCRPVKQRRIRQVHTAPTENYFQATKTGPSKTAFLV